MSCEDGHDVNCSEVLDQLDSFLDRELNDRAVTYEEIEAHLVDCKTCLSEYDLERVVKDVVARSCACEHAPEKLREQILTRIREVRVTYTET